MWPNARISVMGGDVAASLMAQVKAHGDADKPQTAGQGHDALQQKIREQFEVQGSAYYSSARLWDDGIIDPLQTRRYLSRGLALARANPLGDEDLHPLYRM